VSSNPSTGTATVSPDSSNRIPRLPPGEVRRRQISVEARLLREDNRRRTRPAIARGRKNFRVCNLSCSSLAVYREHLQGRRHLAKVARIADGEQKCTICDLTFESKRQYESHIGGHRHRKAFLDQVRDEARIREEATDVLLRTSHLL
jgi:Zinc-finger of C2H2 type